jgi:hypothetical protein
MGEPVKDAGQSNLYDRDYHAWLKQQAALLRAGRSGELDLFNLAEEIEDLGRSERRAVRSDLTIIIMHLLKYRFQVQRRTNSWRLAIREHRHRLRDAFADSPSLRPYAEQVFNASYQDARVRASDETDLSMKTFPETCPFELEKVLNEDYLPED